MEGFNPFKKERITREKLEQESEGVHKTGEILRDMEHAERERPEKGADSQGRNERLIQSAEETIRVAEEYIRTRPGYDELQDIRRKMTLGMSPGEIREALDAFDREYPETRSEIDKSLTAIRGNKREISRLKGRKSGERSTAEAA